jgi:hypothetical protein
MPAGVDATSFEAAYAPRPRRFREWLRSVFAPNYEELPIPPHRDPSHPELTCRHEPKDPVRALGEGDAFEFEVYPTLFWRGTAGSVEELDARAAELRPRAMRTVRNFVLPIARDHAPHRARKLEAEINQRVEAKSWRFDHSGDVFHLSFSVRIVPEEQIREQLRPYQERRIRMECEHALGIQRAKQVDELTRHWSKILDKLDQDPRTIHAAKLSEADFAAVFGDFVKGRQEGLHDLLGLLRMAVKTHGDVGLGPSEYTRAWDRALRAFQRQHGFVDSDTDD